MNNKNLFIVLLVVILVLAGVIAYMQFNADTTVEVSLNNSQAANGNFDYTNPDYGFKVKLNSAWEGYRVFELGSENVTSYDFCLPTTDTTYTASHPDQAGYACPMSVYAIKDAGWNQMADLERASFGEPAVVKDGVRFFTSNWQDAPSDLVDKNLNIDQVESTLSF